MRISNVEVSVLVNERPVKLFGHKGKTYIVANYGAEYKIKVRNDNSYRVMVVASVDGLSVLDGKPASKDGIGYVLNAYSSFEIKGFRKDNETVGAFKFTKKKKGYAKEVTGSSQNSGVIALAIFGEKTYWPNYDWYHTAKIGSSPQGDFNYSLNLLSNGQNYSSCSSNLLLSNNVSNTSNYCSYTVGEKSRSAEGAGISCRADKDTSSKVSYSANRQKCGSSLLRSVEKQGKSAPDFNAATTWGQKLSDKVVSTTFEKASNYPIADFSIYYDIKSNLEEIGIVFEAPKQVSFPSAFPKDAFATPPDGWQS